MRATIAAAAAAADAVAFPVACTSNAAVVHDPLPSTVDSSL